jgi:hypothetical protein
MPHLPASTISPKPKARLNAVFASVALCPSLIRIPTNVRFTNEPFILGVVDFMGFLVAIVFGYFFAEIHPITPFNICTYILPFDISYMRDIAMRAFGVRMPL